jgi:hypothetical protein
MPNMSYCRFQNTLGDLEDCAEALADIDYDLSRIVDKGERMAAKELIELCRQIAGWAPEDLEG